MFSRIAIHNFKSIEHLSLEDLGRVNVLIGENGSGKSNTLEAIACAAAVVAGKFDHEFLASRGVRSVEPELMKSAFDAGDDKVSVDLTERGGESFLYELIPEPGGEWKVAVPNLMPVPKPGEYLPELMTQALQDYFQRFAALSAPLRPFLIYSPEYSALRTFREEGQILPLGIRGEGLFAHLKELVRAKSPAIDTITETLHLLDWFGGFAVPDDLAPGERTLGIRDRFLRAGIDLDQRSANEGFLFLLFYGTLLSSPRTPSFFAIDNVDASLNPRLCAKLVSRITNLAAKHDKQVILTTHNPAALDGLDLTDEQQRLYVISRDSRGRTRARRVPAPRPLDGKRAPKLSEAFLQGYLGGLPKNF